MERLLDKDKMVTIYSLLDDKLLTGTDKITKNRYFIDLDTNIESIVNNIRNTTYSYRPFKEQTTTNNRSIVIPTIRDRITIQALNYSLVRKYNIQYESRNTIVESIIRKLSDYAEFTVLRLDIKNFFSSIPINKLLQKFKASTLITIQEYHLIKELFKNKKIGIPEGLTISNTLSEIYLENFDYSLRHIHPQLNYSARYVDDILLIFNGRISENEISKIQKRISYILHKQYGLVFHTSSDKYSLSHFRFDNSDSFDYLGYSFKKEKYELQIGIADKKVSKIRNQITRVFASYKNYNNFNLLYQRLGIILCSYSFIKQKGEFRLNKELYFYPMHIKCGLYENYKYINAYNDIKSINSHYSYHCSILKSKISAKEYRSLVGLNLFHNNKRNENIRHLSFHKYDSQKFITLIKKITGQSYYKGVFLFDFSLNDLKHIYFSLINEF